MVNDSFQGRPTSHTTPHRPWLVLLIGGASGSGKTSVSYRLAHYFGVGITEVDDIVAAVKRMTTPEQQPLLHFWETDPSAQLLSAEEIFQHSLKVCQVLSPAIEAAIGNHLEMNTPVVIEGDFLLPSLATQAEFNGYPNNGRVCGLFMHEEDEEQFVQNYLLREPDAGRQEMRARISWLHSQWLQNEARATGNIVFPARPWENSFERILESLQQR